jgi:hypothetical protein
VITSLREDGSGADYDSPDGKSVAERYLTLPFDYWTADERWHCFPSLPRKHPCGRGSAPRARSADCAPLRQKGLLKRRLVTKPAPLSPHGVTQEPHYSLQRPFGWSRHRLQVVSDAAAS